MRKPLLCTGRVGGMGGCYIYVLSTSESPFWGMGEEVQLLSPSLLMIPRMCDQSGGGRRGRSSSESRVRRYSSPGVTASEGFQAVHLRGRPEPLMMLETSKAAISAASSRCTFRARHFSKEGLPGAEEAREPRPRQPRPRPAAPQPHSASPFMPRASNSARRTLRHSLREQQEPSSFL